MGLTSKQRAAINRQNAAKSTGPKTVEGKNASRANALKHGLRAEVIALPNEDPDAVRARSDAWNNYYQPQSPAAHHLVNQCVAATLLSDRVNAYHSATLAKQVRDADKDYEMARYGEILTLTNVITREPDIAVRGLRRTAAGCRELIKRWERLDHVLDSGGVWLIDDCIEAIALQGSKLASKSPTVEAWLTLYHAELSQGAPSAETLKSYFAVDYCPESLRREYRPDAIPSPDLCHAKLRALALGKLHELRNLEAALRLSHEDPDHAEAPDRASILTDAASARLFLRYHSEARSAFHRAYNDLVKTLARDASEPSPIEAKPALEAVASLSPIEANPAPEAVATPSPIEANVSAHPAPEPVRTPVLTDRPTSDRAPNPISPVVSTPVSATRAA